MNELMQWLQKVQSEHDRLDLISAQIWPDGSGRLNVDYGDNRQDKILVSWQNWEELHKILLTELA